MGNNDNSFYPDTAVIINCVLNVPLMLISIIGNALVLAAILRTPSLRSPSTVFLCSLAVSDFLVGLVVQPVYIANALNNSVGSFLFQVRDFLTSFLCGVSFFTMTTISVDRFLALRYHMRYPNLIIAKHATYTSANIWFVFILFSCLSVWKRSISFCIIAVGIVVCFIISSFSYIRIYVVVRHHQLQIQAQQQAVNSLNAEHNLNMTQSKKKAINTFIYHICMIICYFPMLMSVCITLASNTTWDKRWNFSDTVAFLNSSINPFLYCWRNHKIRTAVLKIVRKMLCRQAGEN